MLLSITIWKKLPGPPPMWHLSSHSNVQRMGGKPGLPLSVSMLGLTSGRWRSRDKNSSFTHDYGRVNPTSLLKVSSLSTGMPMFPCRHLHNMSNINFQMSTLVLGSSRTQSRTQTLDCKPPWPASTLTLELEASMLPLKPLWHISCTMTLWLRNVLPVLCDLTLLCLMWRGPLP